MIGLALRLALNSGREAAIRLIITAVAVGVGTSMLLMALGGINAVHSQNVRYTWLNAGYAPTPPAPAPGGAAEDPVWWVLIGDSFDGKTIGLVDVAETGPRSPLPPGVHRLPGPDEYVASPAMVRLLASTPHDELGDRYPTRQVGTIGAAGLPSSTSLIIIVGQRVAELAAAPNATKVVDFDSASAGDCGCYGIGFNPNAIDLILAIVAAAMLFPVLIFVGSATRLSAARREQRFAALRLVGATPRQISTISAVESGLAAVFGVLIGFALFYLLRAPVARIPFTGEPFFTSDLSLTALDILIVGVGVPAAAIIAARVALRRVRISPLGVTRRVTPRPPRAYRLLVLLAGLVELGFFVLAGSPGTSTGQILAYLSGILITMTGLLVAGPWFTMVGARWVAQRTGRPAVLLAGRRMADNPHVAFRAMSGLILGLFVTTVAVGVITTIVHFEGTPQGGAVANDTVVADFSGIDPHTAPPAYSRALVAELDEIPGVRAVTTIYVDPRHRQLTGLDQEAGVISCADLTRTRFLGRCAPGARGSAAITPDLYGPSLGDHTPQAAEVWPAAPYSSSALHSLGVQLIVVPTDGSRASIERTRTVLERRYPLQPSPPGTPDEYRVAGAKQIAEYQQLADVAILTSLPIAGCSLAVSVSAGLTERKRPFSLLRLAGTPIAVLRRVVACESVVPLLLGAAVAIGTGFVAAALFLRAQLHYTLQPPDGSYYAIVFVGLVISLGIVASTLPLLTRLTGPETARND